jgi:hypothetical protein
MPVVWWQTAIEKTGQAGASARWMAVMAVSRSTFARGPAQPPSLLLGSKQRTRAHVGVRPKTAITAIAALKPWLTGVFSRAIYHHSPPAEPPYSALRYHRLCYSVTQLGSSSCSGSTGSSVGGRFRATTWWYTPAILRLRRR